MTYDSRPKFAPQQGNKATLSFADLELVETKIIPTARRWLDIPPLRDHAVQTLTYWGEPIPPQR